MRHLRESRCTLFYIQIGNFWGFQAYQLFADELTTLSEYCGRTEDLRNVFDGISEPLYFDFGHVSSKGNGIIAGKIVETPLPIIKGK